MSALSDKILSQDTNDDGNWVCKASEKSLRTHNPLRAIVDNILNNPKLLNHPKTRIPLSIGDPTIFGNLKSPEALISGAQDAIISSKYNGYLNALGSSPARQAIAKYYSTSVSSLTEDDIIIASGCSHALELAITALLDEGTNILVPSPGFPLYEVIAKSHGASVKHYNLSPSNNWEIDLDHLESQIDSQKTRAILINNPSNPCGSVFSEAHLELIVNLAAKHRLPIISDEVYGTITFDDKCPFVPLASVAAKLERIAPVITTTGLAKQFLVPGWRVGWLMFSDTPQGAISEVKLGIQRLSQVVLGASHIAQAAIPNIMNPQSVEVANEINLWRKELNDTLAKQSSYTCEMLGKCSGLKVIRSIGAMYVMTEIMVDEFDDSVNDDVDFTRLLLEEENVFALPGSCFGATNFFRVVYCAPIDILREAFERINLFCYKHRKNNEGGAVVEEDGPQCTSSNVMMMSKSDDEQKKGQQCQQLLLSKNRRSLGAP